MHDFDYFYSRFPLEHNSMRLIVLIRSFNPRRTQFILQDIETRGKSFNPRAHTGRDSVICVEQMTEEVSIHAPTRGATLCFPRSSPHMEFQSTRPHGARRTQIWQARQRDCFNPRAHTGRDPNNLTAIIVICCFNPRAHTGRDSIFSKRLNICIQNYTFCETWQTYTQNCFY